ncbi:MAG: EamA family transporter [Candidatus Vogelbacteria bacterium]|nr:EamA family transporter [Candidatus Vogelbacteria bacterium]
MPWIFPLSLLILFEIIADIFAKEWSLKTQAWYLAFGALASYLIANSFWLFALKNGSGLARGAIIFSVATAIVATILGLFWYQEKVSSVQVAGIIFGLISIVLIFWE